MGGGTNSVILWPWVPPPDNGGEIIPETVGGTGDTGKMPPATAAPRELIIKEIMIDIAYFLSQKTI